MDATLNAIGDLLLKAIPTVLFFLFLTAFLSRVYFKPMARILAERHAATAGLRELSNKSFAAADQKASEYERLLQAARAEIGVENEKRRRDWQEYHAATVGRARQEAEAKVAAARAQVESETAQAQLEIGQQVQPLAQQIIESLLRRRAA